MIQRILLLTLGSLLWIASLWAKPRTETQARLIAEQCASRMLTNRQLTQLRSSGEPWLSLVSAPADGGNMAIAAYRMDLHPLVKPQVADYYVYNIGVDQGYVMISGDDLLPEVIGYADHGLFLPDTEQPEYIASFLASVRSALRQLVERGKPIETPRGSKLRPEGVQPLLGDIQWGQSYPFNLLCPKNAVVGCVATAISQIVRYHQWPKRGQGGCEYTENDGTRHLVDFSQYTYDWANMPAQPNRNKVPKAVETALSTLCYHVGVFSHMNYSAQGSGTYSQYPKKGLYEYFKYKKNIQLLTRMNYQIAAWMDILAEELNAGRPVYYAGASSTVGHAFVCDGYNNKGYFHINLGWNGMSDGYFLLYAISPDNLGTGGGTSHDGYNDLQEVLIGIEPDRDGSSVRTVNESITARGLTISCEDNETIKLQKASLQLTSDTEYNTKFCFSISPTNGEAKHYYGPTGGEQELVYHTIYIYSSEDEPKPVPNVNLKELGLPTRSASYVVTLAYIGLNGEKIPVRHYNGSTSEVTITFDDNGRATYLTPSARPQLVLTDVINPVLRGYNASSVTLCVNNLSTEEYQTSWTCYFEDMKGEITPLAPVTALITSGKSQEVPLKIAKLRLPSGTKGNILLTGEYEEPNGETRDYSLRSDQRVEVQPTADPVGKIATMECMARRSLSGAIEYAPGTSAITFVITNQSKRIRDDLWVEWVLAQEVPNNGLKKRDGGAEMIPNIKGHETKSFNIDPHRWSQLKPGNYYLQIRMYSIIEQFGQKYYGELEYSKIFPVALVEKLSPAIKEDCYISLEKKIAEPYTLSAEITTPDMIRINGLDIRSSESNKGHYTISGLASYGRTAIIGTCSSLLVSQFESTGIVEADFSHASPLLQHVSLCHSQIKGRAMTEMLRSLPDRSGREMGTIALIDLSNPELEGNRCTASQVELAARRGWIVTDQAGNSYAAVETPNEPNWSVYPTPTRDHLTIRGLSAESTVGLYTLQGEKLLDAVVPESGVLQLNLNHLPNGVYILTTQRGTRRIIISH